MGQCGCGDFSTPVFARHVGPYVMAVTDYRGCQDCQEPFGFTITLFTPKEARTWDVAPRKTWVPEPVTGFDYQYFNFFSQTELTAAAREIESEAGSDLDAYQSVGDWLDEHGLTLMQRAWALARKKKRA